MQVFFKAHDRTAAQYDDTLGQEEPRPETVRISDENSFPRQELTPRGKIEAAKFIAEVPEYPFYPGVLAWARMAREFDAALRAFADWHTRRTRTLVRSVAPHVQAYCFGEFGFTGADYDDINWVTNKTRVARFTNALQLIDRRALVCYQSSALTDATRKGLLPGGGQDAAGVARPTTQLRLADKTVRNLHLMLAPCLPGSPEWLTTLWALMGHLREDGRIR